MARPYFMEFVVGLTWGQHLARKTYGATTSSGSLPESPRRRTSWSLPNSGREVGIEPRALALSGKCRLRLPLNVVCLFLLV